MAVELDIDGSKVTISEIATEDTLRRLADTMEGLAPGVTANKSFKEAEKAVKDNTKETQKQTVKLKMSSQVLEDFTDDVENAATGVSKLKNYAKGFVEGVADTANSVVKLGSSTAGVGMTMATAGQTFQDFGGDMMGALGPIGTVLATTGGAMIAHTANLVDTFDSLSATGATFSNNLFEFERVAAASYLSLDQMVGMVRENSEALAAFGGSTRLGAKRFAELNLNLQNTYRRELAMLGISATDSAEMLMALTATQSRNTHFATLSTQQQTSAAADFAKEMQLLAGLTGQDRKALAQKLAQDRRRSDVELRLSRMDSIASKNARTAFMTMEGVFGENSDVMDALRTKFMGLSVASSTTANMLLQNETLGPLLDQIGTGLRTGSMDTEEAMRRLTQAAPSAVNAFRSFEPLVQYNETAGSLVETSSAFLVLQRKNQEIQEKYNGDWNKFVADSTPVLDTTSKGIKDAGLAIQDAGRFIRETFNTATEKTVGSVLSAFGKLAEVVGEPLNLAFKGVTDLLKGDVDSALKNFAKALNTLSVNMGGEAVVSTPEELAGNTGSIVGTAAGALAVGGVGLLAGTAALPLTAAIALAGLLGGSLGNKAMGGEGTDILSSLEQFFTGVKANGEEDGTTFNERLRGLFGFADGGIVRQPTLAMIGEGESDEAVVPLRNNRSIPVDIDMSGINRLADNVERLVSNNTTSSNNEDMLRELKKFNRNAGEMIKRLS